MKHLVLSLTALLITITTLQAQSKKELAAMLTRDLEAYRQYTLALDFDNSFKFMPPKMFEVIPHDSLKATMMQAMDNEYMTIQMTEFQFEAKSKPKFKKAGVYHWTFVPYVGSMRLVLKGEDEFKKILTPIMKSQFGSENVRMEGDSIMNITLKNKRLIAFKDPASPIWSLIEDKRFEKGREGESQKLLFNAILPAELLKALEKN